MVSFNINVANALTLYMDILRTCINRILWHDRWKYAIGTFRMRIEFTLDVKRSYDVCQVSMCVHALLYELLLGDISRGGYR